MAEHNNAARIRYTPEMSAHGLEEARIRQIFRHLESAMGPQHWWPAGSAFEVVAGAYLTQNTAWTNVEQAMANLREANALSIYGIRNMELAELERLVRPAGYFRQKAARLKLFVARLDERHGGSLEAMFAQPSETLREELLGLTGIGPETADSILLYAANHESFVVDSYTRRIFERHGLVSSETSYEEIRLAVQRALGGEDFGAEQEPEQQQGQRQQQQPHLNAAKEKAWREDEAPEASGPTFTHAPSEASRMKRSEVAQRYNEFHALIVQTAKHFCVKGEPKCESCPLREMLEIPRFPRR
jgi:endonuclease-3 related protein